MPERSSRIEEAYAESSDGELPYISKSRVKTWNQNPDHFRLKYVEGLKPSENTAMLRGTQIHELFEDHYNSILDSYEATGEIPEFHEWVDGFGNWHNLARHSAPYAMNFLAFEYRRLQESNTAEQFLPVSVEEEHWVDPQLGLDGEPCWMGLADVIVPAASLRQVESDTGVVIIDFKTGSVPREKYRSEPDGIHTELEYYAILFGNKYDVVGAAAYYPRADELLVQPDNASHREQVENAVRDMVPAVASGDKSNFPHDEGPLCKWGPGDDEESDYYGLCNCTWGRPVEQEERFTKLVERGLRDSAVADKLGCSSNAVRYWTYKLDL